jgi:hypothetical protein
VPKKPSTLPPGRFTYLHQPFWATPDEPGPARENFWRVLAEVGVAHISTDDLAGLEVSCGNGKGRLGRNKRMLSLHYVGACSG